MRLFSCLALSFFILAGGCTRETPAPARDDNPQDVFFASLSPLCGKAFEGALVSNDEVDADFARQRLVIHIRDCDGQTIRIPLHVGDNRSRTWVISKTGNGLRLKHDHRHEDGEADAVTFYGGDTAQVGTATRQEFPADGFSRELFEAEGLAVSIANVWAVEIEPGKTFAYELKRPNRFFRVEFDLREPVEPPPPAWGAR